jgi:hypothetical protein
MRVDHFQQFVVDGLCFLFLTATEGLGGAMMQMISHQVSGYAAERFLDAGDLRDDVGAVAILFDHLLQAADLAFDSTETVAVGLFQAGVDSDRFAGFAGNRASAIGGLGCDWVFTLKRCLCRQDEYP